jgi:hypothetical protein
MHHSINLDENQDVIEMQIEPVIGEIAQGINTSDDYCSTCVVLFRMYRELCKLERMT